MANNKVYAVMRGRITGIFYTYEECKKQVQGFPNAYFKSFSNEEDAQTWLDKGEEGINRLSAKILRKITAEIEAKEKE